MSHSLPASHESKYPEHKMWDDQHRKHVRYQEATCECGETLTVRVIKAPLPAIGMRKRLQANKWFFGGDKGHDKCPRCIDIERAANRKTEQAPSKETTTMTQPSTDHLASTPVAAALATPSTDRRADNRRIAAALDKVYDTERQCYRAGHGDATVARELQLAADWVADIRDQQFGPDDAEEVLLLMERMTRLDQTVVGIETQLREAYAKVGETFTRDAEAIFQKMRTIIVKEVADATEDLDNLQKLADEGRARAGEQCERRVEALRTETAELHALHERLLEAR